MSAFNTHEVADILFGAAKSETAYGTDIFGGSAPSAGEWMQFRNIDIEPVVEHREVTRATATFSGEPSLPVPMRSIVTWEIPLLGKQGADEGPHHEDILKCCGLLPTVDAGVDVAFTPDSSNDLANCPSATFVYYAVNEEGQVKKYLARGVRSNFELVLEQGQPGYIRGEGRGLYDAEPTSWAAAPTLPQQYSEDKAPMVVTNLAVTVGGVTYPVERLTLSSNNSLTEIMTGDPNGVGVVSEVLIHKGRSGNRYGGEIVLVDGASALADLIAKQASGATAALVATLSGGGDTVTLSAPALQFTGRAKQRAGVVKRGASYALNRAQAGTSSGDDDFEIAYS